MLEQLASDVVVEVDRIIAIIKNVNDAKLILQTDGGAVYEVTIDDVSVGDVYDEIARIAKRNGVRQ